MYCRAITHEGHQDFSHEQYETERDKCSEYELFVDGEVVLSPSGPERQRLSKSEAQMLREYMSRPGEFRAPHVTYEAASSVAGNKMFKRLCAKVDPKRSMLVAPPNSNLGTPGTRAFIPPAGSRYCLVIRSK